MARIRAVTDQRMVDREFADIVSGEDDQQPSDEGEHSIGHEGPVVEDSGRSVIVVSGSNGVTEVIVGLAGQLARRGLAPVVADLDTLEPTLAQRLGLALSPNVLSATESLRFDGELGDTVREHETGFHVLAGLPSPREWEACGIEDAADLIGMLAEQYDAVIVRVNRHLEDLSPFGVKEGRFGIARRLVADADQLVVVGDPSPMGVTSVLAWIGEARSLSGAPVHVAMNHCGKSLYQKGEIVEEIGRTFRSASVVFLPEDLRVRKAAWQGETIPQGRFTKALDPIIDKLVAAARLRNPGSAE